jgi:hypothetical protein
MPARAVDSVVAVVAMLTALAADPFARPAGDLAATPPMVVEVGLTVSMDLPAATASTLVAEADAIWRQAGVRLRWPSSPREGPADASLRVLVMQRPAAGDTGHTWPVGELLEDQSGVAFAVVSTSAARRVVASAGRPHDPQTLVDRRLGLVLGRAVAHELGHFLLATRGHARTGLMRAHVDVADFVDLRQSGFQLDRDAGAWIRASLPGAVATPSGLAGFNYPPPR